MHTDRTTKILLAAIALGLWANAFRPALSPQPATAQEPAKPIDVNIARIGGQVVVDALPIEGLASGKPVKVQGPVGSHTPLEVKVVR